MTSHNHVISLPCVDIEHTYLQYMALDLCYICDIPLGLGSDRQLIVARSTSASVLLSKLYSRYCAMSYVF